VTAAGIGHDERVTDDSELLLTAVDQVPFILVVCEGPELRVLALSAATRAVLPGRAWAGRPIREVISDLIGQQFVDAYYEVYRTGEPVDGAEWRTHLTMPDESVLEMYANFTITPWHDAAGTRRGVIGIGFDVTDAVRLRKAAAEERAHLQQRYEQSLDVIIALQKELLPSGLPVLPGAQIAASYLLADAGTAAGGDWFDAIARRDGRVALVVGDVVGHGVPASGVMGQLRAVLQDRLDDGAGIGEALAAADRFAARVPAAHATTVCLALLDPVTGEVEYCTAGHPPPLLVAAGGETRYLAGTGAAPLGTGGTFPTSTDRLGVDDLLLLYSDGILERPGRTNPEGLAELARVAAYSAAGRALHEPAATPAERVCAQTVELLVRATGHTDDITLLAVQRVAAVPDLALDLPAAPPALRRARTAVRDWLDAFGATEQDVFVLQHALGELMTNAIEHAFDGDSGGSTVAVQATLSPTGRVEASVTDRGVWREPGRQPTRGRGLALTAQLVDSLQVEPSATGTVARIRHTLVRPARLLGRMDHAVPASVPPPATFRIVELPGGDETRVRVEGPLDAATAPLAQRELLRRSRGGTVAMTVDLSTVTHLSSAGVSALHHVADQHGEQKAPLRLYAPAGTPAQHVLDLVALPHATTEHVA
jgi:serine phosphatase RsbU (regulator of sigma subunit)/anti-sigma regulatory factor (Ser/Thr protein kinase)/anti-anti-sigma regulatory factor